MAKQESKELATERDIANWVADRSQKLAPYIPGDSRMSQEDLKRDVMLAIMDNNQLQTLLQTKQGQSSMYHALRYAAATGLSLNPQQGKAALVPMGGKVNYWPMKSGYIELLMDTGQVEYVTSDIVHEADEWDPPAHPTDTYHYKPARRNRGEIDGFFAVAKLRDGTTHLKYMDIDQVREHRKKYSSKSEMPEAGYGLKTVLKALCRSLNLGSTRIEQAVRGDDAAEWGGFDDAEVVGQPKGASAEETTEAVREKQEQNAKAAEKPEEQEAQESTEAEKTANAEGETKGKPDGDDLF